MDDEKRKALLTQREVMKLTGFRSRTSLYRRSKGGTFADTQEVLNLCAEHGIRPEIEMINMADINDAFARIKTEDVRFRHVIDMASLKAEHAATKNGREHLEAPTRGDPDNRKTA